MRYQLIDNRALYKLFTQALESDGYKYISNPYTGGDNDWLLVDVEKKRYTFFESGCGLTVDELVYLDHLNISDLHKKFK